MKTAGWKVLEQQGFRFVEGWGTIDIFAESEAARKACDVAGNKYAANGFVGVTTQPIRDVLRMTDAMLKCS